MPPRCIKEHLHSLDIGLNERGGVQNAPIHMGFRGKAHCNIHSIILKDTFHQLPVCNIPPDEPVSLIVLQSFQIGQVSGICELVQIDYAPILMPLQDIADEVASYEAAASGDQNSPHLPSPLQVNPFTASDKTGHRASLGARMG
jgi:hypothetical protein